MLQPRGLSLTHSMIIAVAGQTIAAEVTLADSWGNLIPQGAEEGPKPFLVTGHLNASALNLTVVLQPVVLLHRSSLVYRQVLLA